VLLAGTEAGSTRPVCVECSNGKKFYADVCLITVSLGYLKQHSARLFNPPLPDSKVEAMQRIAMGTCNKIIMEFDGQVLPDGIFRLEMVWDYENFGNEPLAERWFKKIGSFEAVADDVLMGEFRTGVYFDFNELINMHERRRVNRGKMHTHFGAGSDNIFHCCELTLSITFQ